MNKALKVVLSLTAMLAAGCSDSALSAPKSDAAGAALLNKGGNGGKVHVSNDTARFSFVIDPRKGSVLRFGEGSFVNFPANTLCDPYTSSYGPGTWDDACELSNKRLTVTAKFWMDEDNHPRIDFSPDVRFAPTADPSEFVTVTFADAEAAQHFGTRILYCRTVATGCVKESESDPTMLTVTDPATGQVTRRIKHFSGYSITTGDDDTRSSAMNRFVKGGTIQP